jgi:hypothetical protein
LFNAAAVVSISRNLFVKMLLVCHAYVIHIRISFPLLHLGHSVMSLPYFSSLPAGKGGLSCPDSYRACFFFVQAKKKRNSATIELYSEMISTHDLNA